MPVRRTLGLGTLVIRGSAFDFRPSPRLEFEATEGDEVHVGLTYNYEDNSPMKNSGLVLLTIELGGVRRVTEAKIRDLPMVEDRDRRFLGQAVTLVAGEHVGRFTLAVDLEEGPWRGSGPVAKASFREEGAFRVKVR